MFIGTLSQNTPALSQSTFYTSLSHHETHFNPRISFSRLTRLDYSIIQYRRKYFNPYFVLREKLQECLSYEEIYLYYCLHSVRKYGIISTRGSRDTKKAKLECPFQFSSQIARQIRAHLHINYNKNSTFCQAFCNSCTERWDYLYDSTVLLLLVLMNKKETKTCIIRRKSK